MVSKKKAGKKKLRAMPLARKSSKAAPKKVRVLHVAVEHSGEIARELFKLRRFWDVNEQIGRPSLAARAVLALESLAKSMARLSGNKPFSSPADLRWDATPFVEMQKGIDGADPDGPIEAREKHVREMGHPSS